MPAFSAVDIGLLVEQTILLLDPLAIKRNQECPIGSREAGMRSWEMLNGSGKF